MKILWLVILASGAGWAQTQSNFATFTITGTVPQGAYFAAMGPRINNECFGSCFPGYADVVLSSYSYSENGGPNIAPDPNFANQLTGTEEWSLYGSNEVAEPNPNGGIQLHFSATPATYVQTNSSDFPTTPGANFTATFVARVTPQSLGTGYFAIFFLPHALEPGQPSGELTRDVADLESTIFGLSPTQSGFTIQAVAGGGTPPPVSFSLLNGLQIPVDFTITTTTADGSAWLAASPTSGTVSTAADVTPPVITVQANPASLKAGNYYGQVIVTAPEAPNSPQIVSIVLVVAPATATFPPEATPTGLVFTAIAGGNNPAPQSVTLTNIGTAPVALSAVLAFTPMTALAVSPSSATVAPNQPVGIQVAPNIAGLGPGVYRGRLDFFLPATDGNVFVDVLLVVAPGPPAANTRPVAHAAPSTCMPTQLLPVFTLLGDYFSVSAAFPAAVGVKVVDDCGSPLTAGSVSVTFSNGDPPLALNSLLDGEWEGTWAPANPLGSNLVVTANASNPDHTLFGTDQITGAALSNPNVPVVTPGGVVNAASYAPSASPSPGEIISIFGSNLAAQPAGAPGVTLPTQLGGVTVLMAGEPLPLVSVSPAVINAVVPYSVTAGATTQLIVSQGANFSIPVSVPVDSAEPGIFTVDESGGGQGYIFVIATGELADASHPASAGDPIVIICSGLGAVSPVVEAGSPTPSDVLRNTTTTPQLTIGGVPAQILFAGLTPTETALYQVNAVVPAGVVPGPSVPVVLTVGGYGGPPVTMAISQ